MLTGISINLSPSDRARLVEIATDWNSPQKHVWRAQIMLLSADGVGTNEIMRVTDTSKTCVWRWQQRFMEAGADGLLVDKTRPSRIAPLDAAVVERAVALTLTEPPGETTHWTAAAVSAACSISVSSVHRIWRSHGLRPHQIRQFKLSNDPQFAAIASWRSDCEAAGGGATGGVCDIVGLHVNPPEHAVVLSVDEKSQIQALDRTQPGLPLKKGRYGTMSGKPLGLTTHDYKRNGTTTLFAALNVLEGSVIGRCMQRHTHQEFIRFLIAIENQVAANKQVHVVLDNYATHKHPKVVEWLGRHERFTFHFTPTSASWINAVEGFFAKLTKRRLKRGVFHSIVALKAAINRFVKEANQSPKPFRWTKNPDDIIAAVRRGQQALDSHH